MFTCKKETPNFLEHLVSSQGVCIFGVRSCFYGDFRYFIRFYLNVSDFRAGTSS